MLVQGGELPHAPGASGYGGYIRYIRGSTVELQRRGYWVSFGTVRGRSPLHPLMEELGCSTFALNCRTSRDYFGGALRLARLTREMGADILHLHESIQGAIGGLSGILGGSGARVYHRHHTTAGATQALFSKIASKTAHVVMAVSDAAAHHSTKDDRVPTDRVCVAYNGVDPMPAISTDELDDLRRSNEISPEARVVLSVGHLRPEKGHATLIEAMGRVGRSIEDVHLVIVGGGPEETELRKLARDRGTSQIHFVGHQSEVASWYALADVVAVPSYTESFGLVAIEAMAAAKPVVVSDIEGLSEVVDDGISGYLVPARDADALADRLVEILESVVLAESLSLGAHRRFLERFTIERMVDGWIDCYTRAGAGNRA